MPTLQKLADNGLMYSQWHTTALCSPTRSTFLTGRNHHQNGMACITEGSIGYPGASAHIPPECGTMAEVLRQNGYSTFWLGKNHNVPVDDLAQGGTKETWPLHQGWDGFYGFLGGETNNWYPDLVHDNHYIDQPYSPEEGYHLSKDLADHAIQMIRDVKASAPSRPWLTWFCPGANHAPHHAPQEYIDKYKGKFDDGYEAYREWVLPRMIEKGIFPEGTELTPMNPMPEGTHSPATTCVRGHPSPMTRRSSSRTWPRCTRACRVHRRPGRQDHRLPGGDRPAGQHADLLLRRQRRIGRGIAERLGQREQVLQRLAGRDVREPQASRRPGQPEHLQPLPNGLGDGVLNAVPHVQALQLPGRHQRPDGHPLAEGHQGQGRGAPPVPPLDRRRADDPRVRRSGVPQGPQRPRAGPAAWQLDEVLVRRARDAPTPKKRQYYAMLGTRGIWEDGWKAVTVHGPTSGLGHFDEDVWQLFHTEVDRSEAHDLAAQEPEKLKQLIAAWFEEADKFNVLPLDDRLPVEIINDPRPQPEPPRSTYVYYPDTADVPESVAVNVRGRSFRILADVTIATPEASGVIFAHGSRFGGHALFLKDQKLWYVYNFLGVPPEQQFVSDVLQPGKYVLGVEFTKESMGQYHESIGTAKLYVNDDVVATGPMRAQIGMFTLCGDGLCIGRDSADSVSAEYKSPYRFNGGTIHQVEINVGDDQYLDLEKEATAMLARE